jgi:hypothetical protein
MKAPIQKLTLAASICWLCVAAPVTHAAAYLKFEGIKGEAGTPGTPEVWKWFLTPLDPSVNGGVSVAVGDITGDGMDPVSVALLLPAVQKVREAAAQWPGPIPLDLTRPLTDTEIGLLLPAVQKVREAAAAMTHPATASLMDFTIDLDPLSTALLLPAVQKVREATFADAAGLPRSDQDLFGLLLPATRQAFDATGLVFGANRDLPGLLGLPGAGDPNMRFTTGWELQNGLVTLRMDGAPVAAVPEPGTWAMWLGALGIAGVLRRRRSIGASTAVA